MIKKWFRIIFGVGGKWNNTSTTKEQCRLQVHAAQSNQSVYNL